MPNLEGIKGTITRPIGPLPAFAWVLVIVGGYFGYKFLSGRSGSATVVGGTPSTTTTNIPGTDTTIPTPPTPIVPTDGSVGVSQAIFIQTLTDTIGHLRITNNSTGETKETYQFQSPLSLADVAAGWTIPIEQLKAWNPGIDPNTKLPTGTTIVVKDSINGVSTAIAKSTAIIETPSVVALPEFPNNTAVPTPVATPLAIATPISNKVSVSLPTVSTRNVRSSTLAIPTMTPIKVGTATIHPV